MSPTIIVLIALAAVAVLAGVAFVVMGKGGELARFEADHPPLDLPADRPLSGSDVGRVLLPLALWGYHVRAVDDVLRRVVGALSERDARIADLERRLAEAGRPAIEAADSGSAPTAVLGGPPAAALGPAPGDPGDGDSPAWAPDPLDAAPARTGAHARTGAQPSRHGAAPRGSDDPTASGTGDGDGDGAGRETGAGAGSADTGTEPASPADHGGAGGAAADTSGPADSADSADSAGSAPSAAAADTPDTAAADTPESPAETGGSGPDREPSSSGGTVPPPPGTL